MGVKLLLRLAKSPGFPAAPQDSDLVATALERLQARKLHREKDKANECLCYLYKQQSLPDRADMRDASMSDVWLVQQQDCPGAWIMLLSKEHAVLEADAGMPGLLERCLDYKCKNILMFQGPRYCLGDFSAKVLQVTHMFGNQERKFLGTLLELELGPLSDPEAAHAVLGDMVAMISGALVHVGVSGKLEQVQPTYERYTGLPATSSHLHAAVAYTLASVTMTISSCKRLAQ